MARGDQRGVGVIGTVLGATAFLFLLLFAVQVLFGLYATSVVTAVTYDAAKAVAGADAATGPAARADAVANARSQLGPFGDRASFRWLDGEDDDAVALEVRAPRPRFLPRSLAGDVGPGDIVRTARVRKEAVR